MMENLCEWTNGPRGRRKFIGMNTLTAADATITNTYMSTTMMFYLYRSDSKYLYACIDIMPVYVGITVSVLLFFLNFCCDILGQIDH
jgi:hypothetical protein